MIDNSKYTYQFPVDLEAAIPPQPLIERRPEPVRPVYDSSPELSPRVIEEQLIEQDIEDTRLAADISALPNDGFMGKVREGMRRLMVNTSEDLERRLVDAESYIGGALVPKGKDVVSQRFWFHRVKPEDASTYEGVAQSQLDWFWDIKMADGATIHIGYKLLHGVLIKALDGVPVPLQPGEADSFYQMVRLYHQAIHAKMYSRHKRVGSKQERTELKTFKQQIDDGVRDIRAHETVTELNVDDAMDYILTSPNPRLALAKEDFALEKDKRSEAEIVAASKQIVREAYAAIQAESELNSGDPVTQAERIVSEAYTSSPADKAVAEAARIVNEAYATMHPMTPSYQNTQADLESRRSQLV